MSTYLKCVSLAFVSFLLAGCGLSALDDSPATSRAALTGRINGGQQPVSGSSVQLYAANTTTLGGASTALLTTPVTTDGNGNFSITGDYTCPSSSTPVYIVATGGNPGLSVGTNNGDIALMAALGACGSLSSSTFIIINELTTVASVEALTPFMASVTAIGSDSSNISGLSGAFANATSYVSYSTGQVSVSAPSGVTVPSALLNTLADILAACVNSAGGVASDSSSCGKLLGYAGTGSNQDTIAAMHNIVQNPTANVTQLFALATSAAPFQPALSSAPNSWSVSTSIALPNLSTNPYLMVIDTLQHVWVYSPVRSGTGEITIYDTNGSLLQTILPGSGGFQAPLTMKADAQGNVWTFNSGSSFSKFDSNGNALSPAVGFGPSTFEYNGRATTFAIDPFGNVWIGGGYQCLYEFSSLGASITPATLNCPKVNGQTMIEPATTTDAAGNIYILGGLGGGSYVAKLSNSGALLSPLPGYSGGGFLANPAFTAFDRKYNQYWAVNSGPEVGIMASDGTMISPPGGISISLGGPTPASDSAFALDGVGNLWFTAAGGSVFSYASSGFLNELDHTGKILTLSTTSNATTGIHFAGLASPTAIAIDAYGDIWVADSMQSRTAEGTRPRNREAAIDNHVRCSVLSRDGQ